MSSNTAASSAGRRIGSFVLRHWLPLLLSVLAVILIAQNRERFGVHFLWLTVESPMWLLLTVMFVVGLVSGVLLARRRRS